MTFQQRMRRVEELLAVVERGADPATLAATRELVRALLDLHGGALTTMLAWVAEGGESGRLLVERFGADSEVGSLLLLHGLHPLDIEGRARRALRSLAPAVEAELIAVRGDVAWLRARGGAGPEAARRAAEEAVLAVAPEVTAVVFEDRGDGGDGAGRVSLPLLGGS